MNEKSSQSIVISGIGAYKPAKVLTNDDLSKMVDTTDEWIVTRTGIKERRIAKENEKPSVMACEAAKLAIERTGINKEDIDLVIVATMTPDVPYPATACFVQQQLGLKDVPAFDVQAACSGFLYGTEVAYRMMLGGVYKHVLLIGTEKLSSALNWEDRRTCILFGDGAGAVVLSKRDVDGFGILDSKLGTDGEKAEILYQPAGGAAMPATLESVEKKQHFLKMNGKEVFKHAIRRAEAGIIEILQENELTVEDVSYFVPHQANIRIIEALSTRLKAPINRFLTNLHEMGNTSAASIPLAMNDGAERGLFKKGDIILMVAFGAGLTWATTLLKWH